MDVIALVRAEGVAFLEVRVHQFQCTFAFAGAGGMRTSIPISKPLRFSIKVLAR